MSKDDPTGILEGVAEELMEEQRQFINIIGPSLQNRPAFSTPKPKEVEHQEFVEARDAALQGNPQPLQQMLQTYEGVMGFEGRIKFLEWLTKHNKMKDHDVVEANNAGSIY